MFVSFELDTAPWGKINSTVGVKRLVSFNEALPTDLITRLMARCDTHGKVLPADQFAPGDEVQVISGPFADYIATIEKIDADNCIWLLMEFMGQKTQMAVRPGQMQLTK
jgi:transcriptional antiterminator RfaH